jgi:hypothetical protein
MRISTRMVEPLRAFSLVAAQAHKCKGELEGLKIRYESGFFSQRGARRSEGEAINGRATARTKPNTALEPTAAGKGALIDAPCRRGSAPGYADRLVSGV